MADLEREAGAQPHRQGEAKPTVDRELEISVVMVKLGLSFSSVRRLMDRRELRWTKRGPTLGYRIFESSVVEYKRKRDQECM